MDGVKIIELEPGSRDEQYDMLMANAASTFRYGLTFANGGTGSGKGRCIAGFSQKWYEECNGAALTIVNTFSSSVDSVIRTAHRLLGFHIHTLTKDTDMTMLMCNVDVLLLARKKQVILYHGNSHTDGKFTLLRRNINALLARYKHVLQFQIDEIHKQLTHLTGGINGSIYRHESQLESYRSVISQTTSLNLFDPLRCNMVPTICWSATSNHIVASKLGSTGYDFACIYVISVKPIPSLYSTEKPVVFDHKDPEKAVQKFLEAEANTDRRILIVGSSSKQLDKYVQEYKNQTGRAMSFVEITHHRSYTEEELCRLLTTAKYVIGIEKVATGFDLATYVGENFGAVFLCRKCSDRVSQPISGNPGHELYCWFSANFIQAIARARDSGCMIYVPSVFDGTRLVDALNRIYEILPAACKEASNSGPPGITQADRMHLTIYAGLKVNIRPGVQTSTVQQVLDELSGQTERRLEDEYNKPECDHLFWRARIADVWGKSLAELPPKETTGLEATGSPSTSPHSPVSRSASSSSDAGVSVQELLSAVTGTSDATGAPLTKVFEFLNGGGGVRGERQTLLAVFKELEARANGLCACCSTPFSKRQMAHVFPHDQGGTASVDNLVLAHPGCHAMMDDSTLIFDAESQGYWCLSRFVPTLHTPQIDGLSVENLEKRLEWHCKELAIPESEPMSDWLTTNGYNFHPFTA